MGTIPISWQEQDTLDLCSGAGDPRHCMIRFKAVDGDLEKFEGHWKLQEHALGGTEVFFEATIKIGIPVLEQAMGGFLSEKVLKYFERLLQAFEGILTAQNYQQRGSRHVRPVGGFGVIGHPYNYQHLVHYFKSFKKEMHLPSREFLTKLFELTPSYVSHDIPEFCGTDGKTTYGAFIACNIIPEMLTADIEQDGAPPKRIEQRRAADHR